MHSPSRHDSMCADTVGDSSRAVTESDMQWRDHQPAPASPCKDAIGLLSALTGRRYGHFLNDDMCIRITAISGSWRINP